METLYRIVYTGDLAPGARPEEVVSALSQSFRVRESTARDLVLGGGRVILKHDLSLERAKRYRLSLERIGLVIDLEAQVPDNGLPSTVELDPSVESLHSQIVSESAAAPEAAAEPGGSTVCPKCGAVAVSPQTGVCDACGVVVERYLARLSGGADSASLDNPYAPPAADLTPPDALGTPTSLHPPRGVGIGRGAAWIGEGWGMFKDQPWPWVGAVVVYFVIMIVLGLIPLVGGIATTLLGPIFTGGLMLGAHAQQQGGRFEVSHLFAGFSSNPGQLALVGVVYVGLLVGLVLVVVALTAGLFAALGLAMPGMDLEATDVPPEAMGDLGPVMVLPVLFGVLVAIPLMMAVLFAAPLVALNRVPVLRAFKLSFLGCWRNILPFLLYGLVALLLVFVGMIPLGLGLLVVVPVLTIAIYRAYRDIYYR